MKIGEKLYGSWRRGLCCVYCGELTDVSAYTARYMGGPVCPSCGAINSDSTPIFCTVAVRHVSEKVRRFSPPRRRLEAK